jgi:hypothetical protein
MNRGRGIRGGTVLLVWLFATCPTETPLTVPHRPWQRDCDDDPPRQTGICHRAEGPRPARAHHEPTTHPSMSAGCLPPHRGVLTDHPGAPSVPLTVGGTPFLLEPSSMAFDHNVRRAP